MLFKNKGILGINARNLLYIRPYNKKKAIKLADDKIKTKQFLSAREIPVPKLYGMIKSHEELAKFDFSTLPNAFVIKPNNGFGGEGIIPITSEKEGYWITSGGKRLSKQDMKDHISDIIDGRFSISNISDIAFFEQLIVADEVIGKYSYEGLPDIRVVVHNLIPVMAMLRLPTKESGGKANLHLGAVGVGIDMGKGELTHISYKNKIVDELPEGLGKVKGVKIPHWDEILLTASKVQLITNLGYMAVDICLDKHSGPVLLEINARAGLGVQIANLAPLRKRLERIEGVKVTTPTKGVRIAKDMFGNTIEKEITQVSGKVVVSTEEEIEIIMKNKKGVTKILAKIDSGRERSIIDEEFATKLGLLEDTEDYEDEKSTLKLKFTLKNQRKQTVVDVEKIPSTKYKFIVGARDLQGFLIDTSPKTDKKKTDTNQKEKSENEKSTTTMSYNEIDDQLHQIDSKIKLLYHLRPTNLEEEKKKFFIDTGYNPQFQYPKLKFDPLELIDALNKIRTDTTDLGNIFNEKKKEIENKIALLESVGEYKFTEYSIRLFGKPSRSEALECERLLVAIDIDQNEKDNQIYDAKDAKEKFENVFKKYGLKNWRVKLKESMVADCVAGKQNSLFIQKDAKFTRERIESLIIHEIETHILTAENGKLQQYEMFKRGLSNYLTTQEGLAMYNVEKQMFIPFTQNYKALSNVVAIHDAMTGSFSKVYRKLRNLNIPEQQAFRSALKAKRGLEDTSKAGSFTKDYIYFKGYNEIKEFIKEGGDIKDLYIGKINIKDIEKVKNMREIKSAVLLPNWLK